MKKKKIKNLSLKKQNISNLNKTTGGAAIPTIYCSIIIACIPIITNRSVCCPISIFEPCITQTEKPTCRDCA